MTTSGIYMAAAPPSRGLENVDVDCYPADLLVVDPITGRSLGRPQVTLIQARGPRVPLGGCTCFDVSFAASPRCAAAYGSRNNG